MTSLRFVPEHSIAGIQNVVVDGSANADTVLTLSHWPGSPTPPELRADLSAQIAFRALAEPGRLHGIEAVTNNHFDQDGLTSVFTLQCPELAMPRQALLIDVARAGDFATFESRDAARIAMALAALDDDERSPLPSEELNAPYPQRCGALYEWALPRLVEMLDRPDHWRHLWADEDAHLGESVQAVASGVVRIVEHPAIDLAVVTVPEEWSPRAAHRFTQARSETLHPMAVNNSTDRMRIATIAGSRYRVELRYETWVMYTSRLLIPRPDLRLLAAELDALEPGLARWRADAPGGLTPQLFVTGDGESGLSPERFVAELQRFLANAEPAWDPFNPN